MRYCLTPAACGGDDRIEELEAALQRLATFEAFTIEGWGAQDAEVTARVNYARKALGLPPIPG